MSKHTPPPWTAKTIQGFEQGRLCIYGEDPVLPIAALLNGYLPERKADVRLMITAPELLASLIKAIVAYDDHDDMGAWVADARAAIAKVLLLDQEPDDPPPVTYCDYCGQPNPCNKAGCRAAHSAGM